MKILFLCHRFPCPPDSGAKIRPFHMVKHLSRTHEVTLASLVRSTEEARGQADLQTYGVRTVGVATSELASRLRAVAGLATRQPASMRYFY